MKQVFYWNKKKTRKNRSSNYFRINCFIYESELIFKKPDKGFRLIFIQNQNPNSRF